MKAPAPGGGRRAAQCDFCYRGGMSLQVLKDLRRGALAGARELRLAGCGLTQFPPEILGLADTLEVLDLSGNLLCNLPDDIGRMRRMRVLFCSGNRFERLPPALGDCASLSQVGFRGAGLREVPAEALPRHLRWLTLTDNRIEALPPALGQRPALSKLMLAGNALRALPASLEGAPRLELLRIGANRLEALPAWLARHPALAWLGSAGNAFGRMAEGAARIVPWGELESGPLLGQGASGLVHEAVWRNAPGATPRHVAVKLFKGLMTSDGLPRHEMAACIAAGEHPRLVAALGRIGNHPEGRDGLVMALVPKGWRVLAAPPSLESCTRDVYDPALRLRAPAARRIARDIAGAVAHLHAKGVLHGDLYAHNILWDGCAGEAMLSDFGAASLLRAGPDEGLKRLELRAFGLLLGELRAIANDEGLGNLTEIQQLCMQPEPARRPAMAEVARRLA